MHGLSSFNEMAIRNSATEAIGELSSFDNAEAKIEANEALRKAVKTALKNQMIIATALGDLKRHLDSVENAKR